MIQRTGMKPKAVGMIAPGNIDHRFEKITAKPFADEVRDEAEIRERDIGPVTAVQFRISRRYTANEQAIYLDTIIMDNLGERIIFHDPPFIPQPWFADGVVEVAIKADRRLHDARQHDRMF